MGLKGKLIGEVEVKSSLDLFHEQFATKPHHIAAISPSNIQACNVHEGEFGKPGSVIVWNYTLGGKSCIAKEVIESIDEANKSISYRVIEGDLMQDYKTFFLHIHVTLKGGDLNVVKWVLEYEKLHENVPHPTMLLDFVLNVSKHIEEHHLKT